MAVPKVSASKMADTLRVCFREGLQSLWLGAPGIGKTAIIEQIAAELEMDLITIYPALSDPTDLKGYLTLDEAGEPHFRAAGELSTAMAATRPTILFLDELAQAGEAVQRACMSLLWARRVGERRLPDCITFVAASNRNTDRAGAGALNTALLSRFHFICELVPDVRSWQNWATTQGVDPVLLQYVITHPTLLQSEMPTGVANLYDRWPCSRTLAMADKILKAGFPDSFLPDLLTGCIGESAAQALCSMRKVLASLPKLAQVVSDPHKAKIPADLADRQIAVAMFAKATTEDNIQQVSAYIERYPDEEQPRYWALVGMYTPALKGSPEFAAFAASNA